MERVDKYEYPNVQINKVQHYLKGHKRYVMAKSNCNAAIRKCKALEILIDMRWEGEYGKE